MFLCGGVHGFWASLGWKKFRGVKGETSLCVNTVYSQAKGGNIHNWDVWKGRINAFKEHKLVLHTKLEKVLYGQVEEFILRILRRLGGHS